tara:strand:- start:11 stop:349 length:339 start_codon:yes stop_codon:yes gene_type:complete
MSKNRLTIHDLSNIPDVPTEELEIEEWGKTILIQGISKKVQIELGRLLNGNEKDAFDYQRELLKTCVVEPELNDETIDLLYEKDSRVVDKIFLAINQLNGVGGSASADEFQE